jgi:hypothetical protein
LEHAAEACSGEGCKQLLLKKILSQLHYEYFGLANFNELQEQDPRDHSTRLLSSHENLCTPKFFPEFKLLHVVVTHSFMNSKRFECCETSDSKPQHSVSRDLGLSVF